MNNWWIKNTSTIEKSKYLNKNAEKKNYVFIMRKKISSQEMQISTKSNAKINENMNMNNYNNRIMQTKMISDDDVLTTSLMTKHNKKLFINK